MAQGTTKGVPIDIDSTLAANSDLLVPSQKAIKTYVDNSNANQVTSVTGTSPIVSTGGTTPVISIPAATGSINGYLSSTDWTTFNGKQNTLTNPITGTGTNNQIAAFNGTNTITSLTTATYPSLTELSYIKGLTSALQTQLNNRVRILLKNATDASTNSTTNTLLYSGLIPANTLTTGDLFRVELTVRKNNTVGAYNERIYFNTSSSLTGATQIALIQSGNTILYNKLRRLATIKSATNTEIYPSTTSNTSDFTSTGTAGASNLNVDWTVDQYLIVAGNVANTSDTTFFSSIVLEKI